MIQVVQDWRPLWPWVEDGLREVIAKTAPTWLAADVYAELRSGAATLATLADEAGFMVLKRLADYDGPVLFVWVCWGRNAVAQYEDAVVAALFDLARQAGCLRVQMRSPRKGWGRVGWRERETVYEREV